MSQKIQTTYVDASGKQEEIDEKETDLENDNFICSIAKLLENKTL